MMGITEISDQFRKIILRHKRIGYDVNVMRQSVCLVINPITVDNFAALFNCTPVNRASGSIIARPKAIHFSWLGPDLSSVAWSTGAQLILLQISSGVVWQTRALHLSHSALSLLGPRLCFFIVSKRDLFVYRDESLTS